MIKVNFAPWSHESTHRGDTYVVCWMLCSAVNSGFWSEPFPFCDAIRAPCSHCNQGWWNLKYVIWELESMAQPVQTPQPSILVDYEITPSAQVASYPLLEDFLAKLDLLEPHRGWTAQFLIPLRRMGVSALDDMDLVTPESLYVFFRLPPIAIMDLFAHMHDTIQRIHWHACCRCVPSTWYFDLTRTSNSNTV